MNFGFTEEQNLLREPARRFLDERSPMPVVGAAAWHVTRLSLRPCSLSGPNVVIGGGTPNIQKNIIAERLLGQPKD